MSAFPLTLYKKMLFKLHGNRLPEKEFLISTYLNLHITRKHLVSVYQCNETFYQLIFTYGNNM